MRNAGAALPLVLAQTRRERGDFDDVNDFIFRTADGTEMMRLCKSGNCYVRGELVETNQEVWAGFKAWMESARIKNMTTTRKR